MMAEIVLLIFLMSWITLIVVCGVRIFLKIKKAIKRSNLKKSLRVIKGDKK
jgi:hypothetical protein